MKEIVYIVYHNTNIEARSMEILQCCRMMGRVHIVTFAMPLNIDDIDVHLINKNSPFALFSFLLKAKKVIDSVKPDIVMLHDNDCSILISYIKRNHPKSIIIYDSSELYISLKKDGLEEKRNKRIFENGFRIWIKQKVTFFRKYFEKRDLKKCDVVIAANKERADIMKEYFQLHNDPIVFDNIHKIDDDIDYDECIIKYGNYIKPNAFNIVFAGGINPERNTIDFCKAVLSLENDINLIIVGSASPIEKEVFDHIKTIDKNNQLHYLGFVSRDELRFLFQNCQASVVVFDKYSLNTLYCASGKLYESLFENTPILASENPPLKHICVDKCVGVSDDCFKNGILELKNNYTKYKQGVKKYISELDYTNRINILKEQLEAQVTTLVKK